jgi:hypothetical protein
MSRPRFVLQIITSTAPTSVTRRHLQRATLCGEPPSPPTGGALWSQMRAPTAVTITIITAQLAAG